MDKAGIVGRVVRGVEYKEVQNVVALLMSYFELNMAAVAAISFLIAFGLGFLF